MDKNTFRKFVVGGTIFALIAFIILCMESKGKLVESRIGFIGLTVLAALFFLSAYVTPKKSETEQNPNHDQKN